MTSEKRTLIYDLAESFRNALNINQDKFDIEKTVVDIGGKIEFFRDDGSEEEVVKTEDGSFAIRINEKEPAARRRFSIARELGHLFMHMQYGGGEWDWLKPGGYPKPPGTRIVLEEEANVFASAFLVPAKRFAEVAADSADGHFYNPGKIADFFDIYEEAVVFQGRSLGFWE